MPRPLLLLTCLLLTSPVMAETWVNSLFSDGMVLQRNTEIKIWGTDTAGQEVSASLNGKSASAKTDKDGKWSLHLPA